jgi:hypothetical protein
VRAVLGLVPMWGVTSPQRGSGKGKLISSVSLIAIGELPIITTQGANVEEEEKRLTAAVMMGGRLITVDNAIQPVAGSFLEHLITAEHVDLRVFRTNDQLRRVPNTVVIVYNGKQLEITSDVVRRALLIDIDPGVEFPYQLEFPFDPVQKAAETRPQIVGAVCTLLKAFCLVPKEERPRLSTFGNFEQWSDFVRAALVWAGEADPVISQKSIAETDEDRMELAQVINAWAHTIGDRAVTTGELLAMALERLKPEYGAVVEVAKLPLAFPILRAALMNAASDDKGWLSSERLAGWLRRHKNIPVEGRKIVMRKDTNRNVNTWEVVVEEERI